MKVIGWMRRNDPLVEKPPEGMGIGFILNGVAYPMIALTMQDAAALPRPPESIIGLPIAWGPYNEHNVRVYPTPQCDLEMFAFEMKPPKDDKTRPPWDVGLA